MDSFSIFILCLVGILAISGMHKRVMRKRLIMELKDEGTTAADIEKIMRVYRQP